MKKLVTITGAPTTTGMVVRNLAAHVVKIAVFYGASRAISYVVAKRYFEQQLLK